MTATIQRRYPAAGRRVENEALDYWWERAECRDADPELFFGGEHRSSGQKKLDEHAAKLICSHCPVRQECLAEALSDEERHGIWGGLTSRERRRLKKMRETPLR